MHHGDTEERLKQQLVEARKRITELEALVYGSALKVERMPSENLAQALLSNSLQPILIIDQSGTVLVINAIAANRLGYEPTEILGRCIYGFLPPDVAASRRAYAEEVIRTGKPVRFEDRQQNRWFDNTGYPVSDAAGQTTGILVFADDITERKQMEEALRSSEEAATAILNASQETIFLIDTSGIVLAANAATGRGLGVEPSQMIGRSIFDFLPADVAQKRRAAGEEAIRTAKPIAFEDERMGRHFEIVEYPVCNQEGLVTRLVIYAKDITERKRMEEETRRLLSEVQEEKERLSAVINSIQDEVWFADTGKHFTLANPSALREFGFGAADGINVEELAGSLQVYSPHGTPRPIDEAPPLRALKGEVVRNLEEIIRTPVNGELRYREVSSAPVRDARGTIIGSVSVVRDITERKRMEEVLRQSEARYKGYFELGLIGMAITSPTKGWIEVNDKICEILGYEKSELLQTTWEELTHPDDRDADVAQFDKVLAGKIDGYSMEKRFVRKNGQIVYTAISIKGIHAPDGSVDHVLGLMQDITDRKQAEEALRESEQRFTTFMDNSPAIAWMKDEEGRYAYLNKKYENTFNVRLADWLGKSDYEVWPSETAERFRQTDRAVMKQGKPIQVIEEIVDPNGQHRYLLNSKFPLSDHRRKRYVAGIGVDITKHKQADEKVHQLNQELAQRVGELKAINEGLQTFSYSLSHDLRTPLVAIGGFSRRLLDKYALHLDERGQQYLKIINENSRRMEALIAELLVFFKVEKKTIKASRINMGNAVQETFHQCRASYPSRTIQLNIKSIPDMEGDEAMIRNVFTNLFDNAVKYSRSRDATVIEVAGWVEKERTVYYVKDNGIGFPMEQTNKLFKAFERLHTTEEIEGAGLGLAIVRRIIRRHGGDVWAEAKVDEGATFYFSVPR